MTDTPAKKTQKKRTRWIWIICILLLAALLAFVFLRRAAPSTKAASYIPYTASVGTISNALNFNGSLQLNDSAAYTADSDAVVRDVYVQEGSKVQKDDRILRLSNGQTVKAEFDGTVNQLPFAVDDKVKAGDLIAEIADLTHLKARVSIDEFDIGEVQPGQVCRVTVTATEETYTASISSINYISSSAGTIASYDAAAQVTVSDRVLPGMQITLTIPQQEAQNVVLLNMDALHFDENNNAFVLMKDEKDKLIPVYVKTGVSNGRFVEITSGLESGDVVYGKERNFFKDKMNFEKMMDGGKDFARPMPPKNFNMGGGM